MNPMNTLTRRRLLQGAIAAGALPIARMRAAETVGPVMARLSSYMAEAKDHALPPEAVEKTKQIILDTFAAMISGSELPPGKLAIQLARVHSGEKVAAVAGSNVICGPIEAALSNGMLAHSDETDDSHSPSLSHPGCSVVPVALAASEQFDADGTRFLRAVALGWGAQGRARFAELYLLFLALLVAGVVVLLCKPSFMLARPQLLLALASGWLMAGLWYLVLILSMVIGISNMLARRS